MCIDNLNFINNSIFVKDDDNRDNSYYISINYLRKIIMKEPLYLSIFNHKYDNNVNNDESNFPIIENDQERNQLDLFADVLKLPRIQKRENSDNFYSFWNND